jgi:NAD(P)-dependent dehydrogenase (short-subunit alcohol dehydrogenase family)
MLAKHARKALKDSERSWFASVSGRVGSIADNELGGWYSYRASKAALNMALKTLAIEWRFALPRCTVASLHPGTVKSPLSEPFTQRTAPERLFTPEQSAEHLKKVLLDLTPAESGRFGPGTVPKFLGKSGLSSRTMRTTSISQSETKD